MSDRPNRDSAARQDCFCEMINAIDVHICVSDFETHEILFMNRRMRLDFNAEAAGGKCHEVIRGEPAPCPDCNSRELLEASRRSPQEALEWESLNPVTERHYLHRGRAVSWKDGRWVRLQISTDITRLKESEQEWRTMQNQLLHSRKMEAVGTLAGGIAHEFNNLMMVIQGRTSLMRMHLDPAHPHSEHLKGIESCLDTAKELTNQLLGVYSGRKSAVMSICLNDIVDECAQVFQGTRKKIHIRKTYEKSLWKSCVDRKMIRQVILNLYINAWQAMFDGGELTISTENYVPDESFCRSHDLRPGPFVRCSVGDNGIGMDPPTLSRIFDPFFTTKGVGRGAGLGLAAVHGIIRSHRGTITVRSGRGRGTLFRIYLPADLPEGFSMDLSA